MERHGVVVYVLAFSVDGRPRFAAVIRHFAVVTGDINTVKLMLVSEYFWFLSFLSAEAGVHASATDTATAALRSFFIIVI